MPHVWLVSTIKDGKTTLRRIFDNEEAALHYHKTTMLLLDCEEDNFDSCCINKVPVFSR